MKTSDFETFVASRWSALVRSAYLMGCSIDEAEDQVQSTLAGLYSRWDRVASADNPDGYVYRSLLNSFRRSRRRRWWGEVAHADLPESHADPADESVDRVDLRAALHRVHPDRRAVLVLKFFHDLTDPQVAELLDLPLGTVKSRVSRGLEDLRRLYPDTEQTSGQHAAAVWDSVITKEQQ